MAARVSEVGRRERSSDMKVTIELDEGLLRRAESVAKGSGRDLSQLCQEALERRIGESSPGREEGLESDDPLFSILEKIEKERHERISPQPPGIT